MSIPRPHHASTNAPDSGATLRTDTALLEDRVTKKEHDSGADARAPSRKAEATIVVVPGAATRNGDEYVVAEPPLTT